MYTKPIREGGYWITRLLSGGPIQCRSLSRTTVSDWIKANSGPPPTSYRHNVTLGRSVWRERG